MEFKTYPEFSKHYPLLLTTFMKRPLLMYPDDIGLVYRNPDTGCYFRFTWRDWYERTCRLAHALKNKLGVTPGTPGNPGDRVATMAKEISGSASEIRGETPTPKHQIQTDRLRHLGMSFGGRDLLYATVKQMVQAIQNSDGV